MGDYCAAHDVDGFASKLQEFATSEEAYEHGKALSKMLADTYSEEANYALWKDYYHKIYEKYKKKK